MLLNLENIGIRLSGPETISLPLDGEDLLDVLDLGLLERSELDLQDGSRRRRDRCTGFGRHCAAVSLFNHVRSSRQGLKSRDFRASCRKHWERQVNKERPFIPVIEPQWS